MQTLLALLGPFTLYSLGAKVLSFHFELNQNDAVTTITNLFTFFVCIYVYLPTSLGWQFQAETHPAAHPTVLLLSGPQPAPW